MSYIIYINWIPYSKNTCGFCLSYHRKTNLKTRILDNDSKEKKISAIPLYTQWLDNLLILLMKKRDVGRGRRKRTYIRKRRREGVEIEEAVESSRGQWSREGTRYEPKAYARASDKVLSCESPWPTYTRCALIRVTNARASIHARTHARTQRSACAHTRCTTRRTLMREGALYASREYASTRECYSRSHIRTREEFSRSLFFLLFLLHSHRLSRRHLANAVLLTPSKCIRDERKWRH